ncbi:MAG: phenylacetate--CoA ligase family protein [Casimicrobiaceae bacterium]
MVTRRVRDSSALAVEHAHTLHRLWRHRDASRAALRQFQVRKLRVLVAHCRRDVAAYREHWRAADLSPADITTPEDIRHLPTIGKNELRSRPVGATIVDGADPRRLVRHLTSGSSGQPFTIYRSKREEHLLNLFRMRAYARVGVRLFDRIARFQQMPLDRLRRCWPGRLRQGLGIYREEVLDAMAPVDEMIEQLLRCRPDVVAGYASTLQHVAAGLRERGLDRTLHPRVVFTGAEVLGTAARRRIEQAFSAPLVDLYGSHEFNLLASQCRESDGYHVCDDNVLLEVLGEDGRPVGIGETGEVVATALHSYTMPFVRYRTGDLAIRGPDACPCGRAFSTLRAIQGRATDYLRLPGGRCVHPFVITGYVAEREAGWVSQLQLVETDLGRVLLKIQPESAPRPEDIERVRAFGAAILGADVHFDVTLVDGFVPHRSGKFPLYVSLRREVLHAERSFDV